MKAVQRVMHCGRCIGYACPERFGFGWWASDPTGGILLSVDGARKVFGTLADATAALKLERIQRLRRYATEQQQQRDRSLDWDRWIDDQVGGGA